MKLVVAKPNLPDREIGIVAVNGHRLVTDEGVFCLTPLADEWGQPIADGDKLPPFGMVEVSPVLDRPDLTVEFPEEAIDQYELHLAYSKAHGQTPRTREQHKASEQAELERVFGLPDELRPYCLTGEEQVFRLLGCRQHGLSADRKVRFRALFQSGDTVTKWFLEDFQPAAPTLEEASLRRSAPSTEVERRLIWWHLNLEAAQGKTKEGKAFVVSLSAALREVLAVLLEKPGQAVPQKRLNERISISRKTQDYRAAKIFRSTEAKELFRHGVLQEHKAKGGKSVCFSVASPVDPPTT